MDNSERLGPVLKAWFKQWDWPQSVTEGVARAKGWENGPWASQISICMSGRLTPKPAFFEALGTFNRVVAERDFASIIDRRLLDRLRNGQPLTHEDGIPWTAVDFFACYTGQLQGPEVRKQVTQEDVDIWQAEVRACWKELVLTVMETPAAVWKLMAVECKKRGLEGDDLKTAQEIIIGVQDATLAVASRLAIKYPDKPLIYSMIALQEAAGGDLAHLKKLLAWRSGIQPADFPLPSGMPVIMPTKRPLGFDVLNYAT
nr:hypothetical protein [uncultured Mediterranean phage uvMED]